MTLICGGDRSASIIHFMQPSDLTEKCDPMSELFSAALVCKEAFQFSIGNLSCFSLVFTRQSCRDTSDVFHLGQEKFLPANQP